MNEKWIKDIFEQKEDLKKQLNIPEEKEIPIKLIDEILSKKAGEKIKNPTKIGKETITVTKSLEIKAIIARNIILYKLDIEISGKTDS